MKDSIFGPLEYDCDWVREIDVEFFSRKVLIKLVIEGYENEEISEAQRESYILYEKNKDAYIEASEKAIFDYYKSVCSSYREKFGERADEWAPLINKPNEIDRLISLEEIYFPECECQNKIFGFLLSCSWEPELGLAVKFKNGEVDEVGHQDILL